MTPVLSRALALETPVRVTDGAGGFSETWTPLGTLWAEVSARAARDSVGVAGRVAVAGYRITVRGAVPGASNRPRPGQRFREGTRLFRILGVTEADPAARYLACTCEEEVAP